MEQQPALDEKSLARLKNFIGESVLVFFLYLFLYLPGLVVNILYYIESRRIGKLAGHNPPGQGCLLVLLVWGILMLFGAIFFLSSMLSVGTELVEQLMREFK